MNANPTYAIYARQFSSRCDKLVAHDGCEASDRQKCPNKPNMVFDAVNERGSDNVDSLKKEQVPVSKLSLCEYKRDL